MTVGVIIKHRISEVISVGEHGAFLTVAEKLTGNNIGVVVVLNGMGGLEGIVSERDLVRAIVTHGNAAFAHTARDLMTRDVVVCSPEDTELHVVKLMLEKHLRHMPVVSDRKVVGMVSLGDAIRQRLTETGYLGLGVSGDRQLGAFTRHLGSTARSVKI